MRKVKILDMVTTSKYRWKIIPEKCPIKKESCKECRYYNGTVPDISEPGILGFKISCTISDSVIFIRET